MLTAVYPALFLLFATAAKPHLAPPTALSASTATKSAVSLTWTPDDAAGTKQVVERKALGGAWPTSTVVNTQPNALPTTAAIAVVTTNTVTDDKIDQFTTYVYRIRTLSAANALSVPSNEIIVGPPPVGFSSIIATPAAMQAHSSDQFASVLRMTLDGNGDPLLAYLTNDLNNDGELDDSDLSVITWNRARYRWNAPVSVDTVGNVSRGGANLPYSLAFDASTGGIGVLYQVGDHELRLSTSADGGLTWKRAVLVKHAPEDHGFSTPSLAMASGRAYAAYAEKDIMYRTGAASADPASWSSAAAPLLPGTFEAMNGCVNVIVDGAGKPAVSYCLTASIGYNVTAALWHPESNQAVKITDTDNHQADNPALALGMSGTQLGAVFYSPRDDKFFANHHLWFTKSANNGASWSPAVVIADDGGNAMGPPATVSLDRNAHIAIAANVDGGTEGASKCGIPKLIRSNDGGQFTVCAPDTKGFIITGDAVMPTLKFADNDKVYYAFKSRAGGAGLKPGLMLWRER